MYVAIMRVILRFTYILPLTDERLGGVQRYFSDEVRDDYANGRLDAQVETALQEIRELSICGA